MSWQRVTLVVESKAENEFSEFLMEAGAMAVTIEAADDTGIFQVDGNSD